MIIKWIRCQHKMDHVLPNTIGVMGVSLTFAYVTVRFYAPGCPFCPLVGIVYQKLRHRKKESLLEKKNIVIGNQNSDHFMVRFGKELLELYLSAVGRNFRKMSKYSCHKTSLIWLLNYAAPTCVHSNHLSNGICVLFSFLMHLQLNLSFYLSITFPFLLFDKEASDSFSIYTYSCQCITFHLEFYIASCIPKNGKISSITNIKATIYQEQAYLSSG